MKQLMNKAGDVGQDNLIARALPPAETTGVTIRKLAAAAAYQRGTVMALSSKDNKLVLLGTAAAEGETLTAAYILCDDVKVGTAEDAPAVAYRTGCFNKAAVIAKDGYTIAAGDIDALRKYGIVLMDNMQ